MCKFVFALTSTTSGALSDLKEIYNEALHSKDLWYFVVGDEGLLNETNNVKVLTYSNYRKPFFKIIAFIDFVIPKLVAQFKPDEIISLMYFHPKHLKGLRVTTYATNALFFCEKKFRIWESISLWGRQIFLRRKEYKCLKKSTSIITECDWMKKAISAKLGLPLDMITVKKHSIVPPLSYDKYSTDQEVVSFFYPASGYLYKNHSLLFQALLKQKDDSSKFKLVLTLNGKENKRIKKLKKIAEDNQISIEWLGYVNKETLYHYYSHSVLVFPSYLETIGLPLIECQVVSAPIIAVDLPYSREVLVGYSNVDFFAIDDVDGLACLMKKYYR